MSLRLRVLVILASGLFALGVAPGCGKKDPPPTPAEADTARPAPEPADTSPAPAPEADAATAAAPEPDTTAAPESAADTTEAAAPASLPDAVAAALNGATAGCVGFAGDGSHALILLDAKGSDGVSRRAVWVGLGDESVGEVSVAMDVTGEDAANTVREATVKARAEILGLTGGAALVPCHMATAVDGAAAATPLGKRVEVSGGESLVAASGERSVTLDSVDELDDEEGTTIGLRALYWGDDPQGNVFALATRGVGDNADLLFHEIDAVELGIAPCLQRPAAGPAATAAGAAVPIENLPHEGCVLMTKDGGAALFVTSRSDAFGDDGAEDGEGTETREVAWFGPGAHPEIGLDCLASAGGCSAKAKAAAAEVATKEGLVACRALGAIVVAGHEVGTLGARDDRLWLEREGNAPRWVATLEMSAHDGGDHESFVSAYQGATGGPVFALISNEDTGLREARVRVLDDAALGYCPPAAAPAPAPDAPAPAPDAPAPDAPAPTTPPDFK